MTIRDIARLADVTPGTVSKVLNNYPDIGEATRRHVLDVIAENGYEPKTRQRAKKTAAPRVGLVLESVYHPFYAELEDILSIRLHNAGYTLISFHDNYFIQDKQEKFSELLQYYAGEQLNALIYIGGDFRNISEEEFSRLPCPAVFVNTMLPCPVDPPRYSSVQISHYETARNQMRYLIAKGHRAICTIISSRGDTSVFSQRYQAYRDELTAAGLDGCLDWFLETDYQYEKAYQEVLRHFKAHPETTAICCGTDVVAPAVLRALRDLNRKAGEDVQLLSFDGLHHMPYLVPSVSTFEIDTAEMARYILHLLDGLIAGTRKHQHITFHPTLKRRETA